MIELAGLAMFLCFVMYMVPNLVKVWRTKGSNQHSILTPILGFCACFFGIIYVSLSGPVFFVLVDYSMGLIINGIYIYLIIKYRECTLSLTN